MQCWSEDKIERFARQLARAGIDPFARVAAGTLGNEEPPGEAAEFLSHVQTCVRCGELLDLVWDIESAFLNREGDESPEGAEERIELRAMGSDYDGLEIEPGSGGSPFRVAADSPQDAHAPEKGDVLPTDPPVVSLSSEDGSCVVRIFPSTSEAGATAVLLQPPEKTSIHPKRPEQPSTTIVLDIDGQRFPFDEHGFARIPMDLLPRMRVLLCLAR